LVGLELAQTQAENEGKSLPGFSEMTENRSDVTAILRAAQEGDSGAAAQLLPLVYDELRKLAQARMANLPPGQTLQPTALVHEAYLRLLGKHDLHLDSRRHFFFVAARAMRDILVEQARSKAGPKRGGDRKRVELNDADVAYETSTADEVLALNDALAELEKEDPVKAQIVNLRYFTGMSMKEAADVLNMSERTIHRQWRFIKAWLKGRFEAAGDRE
jgi:RNA polymerase sigma factor (TIGR02999 family)